MWQRIIRTTNLRFPMKYWGYLAAKLAGAVVLFTGIALILEQFLPKDQAFKAQVHQPFGHSLGYTLLAMSYFWVAAGLLWAIIWDHRYRCRACLKRLRMPIATGSWGAQFLLGRPRIEYICPFGHGTLRIEELQITGRSEPDWQPHEDIWKELLSLETKK